MNDNDHERSEVPRLVLHVLCWGERERQEEGRERGEGVKEGERERERGEESAEAGVHLTATPRPEQPSASVVAFKGNKKPCSYCHKRNVYLMAI